MSMQYLARRGLIRAPIRFEVPLCTANRRFITTTFSALGVENESGLQVLVEATTTVATRTTNVAYVGIPREGHAALKSVLESLALPPAPLTLRDRGAGFLVGAARGVLLAGAALFFGVWATVMLSIVTRTFGRLEAALGGYSLGMVALGAFSLAFLGILTNLVVTRLAAAWLGEPTGATTLRGMVGAPGPARSLGQWRSSLVNAPLCEVLALSTLDRGHFALVTTSLRGWTALPIPAAAAAPLRQALDACEVQSPG